MIEEIKARQTNQEQSKKVGSSQDGAGVTMLVLSDKNSRNYVLYQGTPSGVAQRSAPDDRQGL